MYGINSASLKSQTRAQGTHVSEIVRKGAKTTQVFEDVWANFRPKLARHQGHKERNSTTVHWYTQKFQACDLNRIEPKTAVCQGSVLQRLGQTPEKSLGTSFQISWLWIM